MAQKYVFFAIMKIKKQALCLCTRKSWRQASRCNTKKSNMDIIKRNKKAHIRGLIMASVALCVATKSAINNFTSPVEWRNMMAFFIVFLGLVMLFLIFNSIVTLLKSGYALKIDEKGIEDNVSFSESGFISWDNIENVSIEKYKGGKLLVIRLKDNFEKIVRTSIFKKIILEEVESKFGNALGISKDYIEGEYDDILAFIKKYQPNLFEEKKDVL